MHPFATYLSRQEKHSFESSSGVISDITIVIPCYNEPNIHVTIKSLLSCYLPPVKIRFIVVINSSTASTKEETDENKRSYSALKHIIKQLPDHVAISMTDLPQLPVKLAGAGYARKVGMDEAIRLWDNAGKKDGILVSLDADCLVKKNYLQKIWDVFHQNKKIKAAIIHFEHILPAKPEGNKLRDAGYLYELYLRYYKEALKYTGFPYYYHTIGSAFAVRADVYVQTGGMNRKNAGEDFYFLQKIFPLGGIEEINDTAVYPQIRISERVVFGTGPALKKITAEETLCWKTYSLNAFLDLKEFFSTMHACYQVRETELVHRMESWPLSVRSFLQETGDFPGKIREINTNTTSQENFTKRFFQWFNAFRIIKFMHFAHPRFYHTEDTEELAIKLLHLIRKDLVHGKPDISTLLSRYREIQTGFYQEDLG